MARSGDILSYWAKADGELSHLPEPPRHRQHSQTSLRDLSPSPPKTRVPSSSTLSRHSDTTPESPPGSPDSLDSFPPSPSFARKASSRSNAIATTTQPERTYIRDSDEDDFGEDDDDFDDSGYGDPIPFQPPLLSASATSSFTSTLTSLPSTTASTIVVSLSPLHNVSQRDLNRSRAPEAPSSSDRSSTPPTKRRANTLLSSPLALRRAKQPRVSKLVEPPKHKFDMQALLRHAEQDNATEAAARRVSAAFAAGAKKQPQEYDPLGRELVQRSQSFGDSGSTKAQGPISAAALPLLDSLMSDDDDDNMDSKKKKKNINGAGDGDDVKLASFNKERLRKAFHRTEINAVSEQWYFFKEHYVTSPDAKRRRPFPHRAATGRWTFLQEDDTMRRDYFASGIVRQAVRAATASSSTSGAVTTRSTHLPDELFLWILDEVCNATGGYCDGDEALRNEYMAILRCCPEQVRQFVDTERLLLLFQKLGPRWESIDLSPPSIPSSSSSPSSPTGLLELVPAISQPYPGHDWAPLRALLALLAVLSESLAPETIVCATKVLLRLGIDKVVEEHMDLIESYQEAMRKLIGQVPRGDWDDFCYDVGLCIYNSIRKPALQWQVLVCLPADTGVCHELRRRLASVFLYHDAARARQDPRQHVRQNLARLAHRDDFVLTVDTDYVDFAALVDMLDVYVDGGDPGVSPASFDSDIDELAWRVKTLGQGIEATGGGHASRLDSKTALDRLQIRLTHAVRTKRPGKKSIFDRVGGNDLGNDNDGLKPKQKDIRSFFLQKLAKRNGK